MKNRISLSGMTNDMGHLDPVRRVLAVFVVACAAVLLLAAGSPPLQAQARTAPEDEQAFHRLVVGQRMASDDNLFSSFYYVDFVAASRFRETGGSEIFTGSYTYENTGSNTGTLTFNYDDGDRFRNYTLNLVFTSTTTGTAAATDTDGESVQFNWRLIPIPDPLTTLYFPDYADGGGWSVQLAISNIDTTEDAAVLVASYDREGQVIWDFFETEYIFEGGLVTSLVSDPFEIPPLGTRVLKSNESHGDPPPWEREFRRGWIEVKIATESVSGLLTYRNAGTGVEVSVEPVELGDHFALFVEESTDIGTGLAIFKPVPDSRIEFRIHDEDGINPLGEGFVTHPVEGRTFQQGVGSIPRWFAVDGIDTEFLKDFRGLLFLRAEDGALFAPLGIRFGKRGRSLSAVPVIRVTGVPESPAQLAPEDEAAFNDLIVGKRVRTDIPNYYIDFISAGRFKETEGSEVFFGSYTYRNTGPNTGTATLNYDDGDRCTLQLTFATATSGSATFSCNDGTSGNTSWRLVDIPSDDDDEDTSQTCVKGSVIKPGGSCDLKDADGMKIGTFSVSDSGRGCLRIGSITLCQGNRFNHDGTRLNQYVVTFIASKGSDGSWTISKISIS